MFFIFGSPRSGTTLLAQSLNQHSEISIPHETDFIVPAAFILNRVKDPAVGKTLIQELICNSVAYSRSIGEYLQPEQIRQLVQEADYSLSAILGNLYDSVARVDCAKIAGDKSPNDLNFLRILVQENIFKGEHKVIHIIRDVRDVMVSLNRLKWVPDVDLYFPRFWSNSNLYLSEMLKDDSQRYTLVKYEDLVSDYSGHLQRLCTFLGVPYEDSMTDHNARHTRYRGMDHHQRLFQPVTASQVGVSEGILGPDQKAQYEKQAMEALVQFGYQV